MRTRENQRLDLGVVIEEIVSGDRRYAVEIHRCQDGLFAIGGSRWVDGTDEECIEGWRPAAEVVASASLEDIRNRAQFELARLAERRMSRA